LTLAPEFCGNTHQVTGQRRKVMSQQSDEDRVPDQVRQETAAGGSTQLADRGSGGGMRRGVLVVLLGVAVVLGLGYVLLSAGTSPATVSWFDRGPDQSTGTTDPNGPQQ
jgi:hypothetical protein